MTDPFRTPSGHDQPTERPQRPPAFDVGIFDIEIKNAEVVHGALGFYLVVTCFSLPSGFERTFVAALKMPTFHLHTLPFLNVCEIPAPAYPVVDPEAMAAYLTTVVHLFKGKRLFLSVREVPLKRDPSRVFKVHEWKKHLSGPEQQQEGDFGE